MTTTSGARKQGHGKNLKFYRKYYKNPRKRQVPVGPAIAPVIVSRIPVFQPKFKNLNTGTWTWETAWGTVTVSGRLGALHRKVLDAIFAEPIKTKRIKESGAQMMVIDPYQVEKLAGVAHHPQWLKTILRDMQQANVTIINKITGVQYWGHIISDIWLSQHPAEMPGGALTGQRALFVVTISPGWMQIYDTSIVMKYRNVLPVLASLESGATYAMILHVLTHSGGCFAVDDVLQTVGVPWPSMSRQRRHAILREVRDADPQLQKLGMELYIQSDGRLMVSYHPTGDITFANPPKAEIG